MPQESLPLALAPHPTTEHTREGWEFVLTEREVLQLRQPITSVPGGWQGAVREAATRIFPGRRWKVSHALMGRLYRMCCEQGPHGDYQKRLPLRVLSPIFVTYRDQFLGTWFYGKQEPGDTSRVKLGKTDRPSVRTRPSSTDNPRQLRLLFCIWDPSGTYETRVKARYAAVRTREWYLCTPAVAGFVAQCQRAQTTAELPQWAP